MGMEFGSEDTNPNSGINPLLSTTRHSMQIALQPTAARVVEPALIARALSRDKDGAVIIGLEMTRTFKFDRQGGSQTQ